MIKKYRNALLAAAVALAAVGCGGSSNEDPLANDPITAVLGNDGPKKEAVNRAIAQLLGGALLDLMNTTGTIFDTFVVITSPETSAGKLLSNKSASTAPSGATTYVEAKCSVKTPQNISQAWDFRLDVQLDLIKTGEQITVTPAIEKGFEDFANGVVDIALGLTFVNCNEPMHIYNDIPDDPLYDPDAYQMLHGGIFVKLHSENVIPGSASDKDFQMQGTVKMDNYFIQKDLTKAPEVITGDIGIALVTTDVDTGNYNTSLDFGITSSDSKNGGSTRSTVKAEGTIALDSKFSVGAYTLSLGGSLRNVGGDAPGTYTLFTEIDISKPEGVSGTNPQSGRIGIIDSQTKLVHYATITTLGLDFDIAEENGPGRKASCTWDQINEKDGAKCEI